MGNISHFEPMALRIEHIHRQVVAEVPSLRLSSWLKRVVAPQLGLFAHCHITYAGMTER